MHTAMHTSMQSAMQAAMKPATRARYGYVGRHWRGECSLAVSFWLNFLAPFVALNYAERFVLPPYVTGETRVTFAVIGFFVAVRLVIYPWQAIGLVRACERCIAARTERIWALAAEGAVVLSVAATLTATISSAQSYLAHQREWRAQQSPRVAPVREYALEVVGDGALIHLRGALQVGVTKDVARLLADNPRVRGIILDSGGGQIYEGRGLAKLVREHRLATYSLEKCASSCATAFIAGTTRTLGVDARIGFHQYKNYAALPVVDIDAEHAKDIELFKQQGVTAQFLRRVFVHAADQMWWPAADELIDGNVVHRIGDVHALQ